ncbi:hypothetical protein [Proteus terrae]|uniref:hypothetical protein n=1 Tax=Proteus terrae TaxID=1574161 RepID=UPI00298C30EC|nr:hypothetical protein [Proteus terrae]WPC97920.1 hypothetical protein R5P25_13780 [Proteus terrae]
MKIESNISSLINAKINMNEGGSNKSTLKGNISNIDNKNIFISLPIIVKPNIEIYMMKLGNKNLESSITNISNFKNDNIEFSEKFIASFLAPNSDKLAASGQSKLQNINRAIKVEIPKINNEKMAVLSNEKKDSEAINSQMKGELDNIGKGSQKSEDNSLYRKDGAYNKLSKRYDLNSSNFSPIKNLIDDKKISTEEKERELKKYLARNDSEIKKMNRFERFKDIFGMSKKINILRNQQDNDAKIIFYGLSNLHNSIVNKDIS